MVAMWIVSLLSDEVLTSESDNIKIMVKIRRYTVKGEPNFTHQILFTGPCYIFENSCMKPFVVPEGAA